MTKIIAEVGSVHDGSFGNAERLIEVCAEAGVWAIKFQHHIAKEETTKSAPNPSYFNRESRSDYFKRTSFSNDQWVSLRKRAHSLGLKFIVSPFSIASVSILEDIGIDIFKIASGEVTNIPMLEDIATRQIPVILSSGMSTFSELDDAVECLKSNLLTVMQCTSQYPCEHRNVGLETMNDIAKRYMLPASLSDHTLDTVASIIASYLGAEYIERHVTFSRDMYGSDARHSLTIKEISGLVHNLERVVELRRGVFSKDDMASNLGTMKATFEKSLVYTQSLDKGTMLSERHLTAKKPGTGIPTKELKNLLGKTLLHKVEYDQLVSESDFS